MVVFASFAASAAGTVLGEKLRGPQGEVGPIGPAIVPTTEVGPATPAVGAVAPGNLDDPAGPAYGILKD